MSLEKARELCMLLKSEEQLRSLLIGLSDQIFSDPDDIEQKTQFRAAINLSVEPFMEKICEIYSELYSEEELDTLLSHRKSPLGRKEIELRPLIEKRSNGVMEKLMQDSLRKIGVKI